MLVSFVIPAHNAAATLQKAVESLQAQTVGNWEAVIVDDGSTDDTLLIAKRLAAADTRLRVFTQTQGGPSAERNAGIDAVRGDGLVFLDADDWLLPAYLERMLPPLAAIALLAAGLDGIQNMLEPGPKNNRNLHTVPESDSRADGIEFLPTTFKDAVQHFEGDAVLHAALGRELSDLIIRVKRDE
jgi:glycosyltransferase involved in cell wall biosynthesis